MEWKYGNGTAFCGTEMEIDFSFAKIGTETTFSNETDAETETHVEFSILWLFCMDNTGVLIRNLVKLNRIPYSPLH
jgi:hypothetical protein